MAHAAVDATQSTVLADLKRDCGVAWSVETLRRVIAATWEGMTPHFQAAQVAQVLAWMEQAGRNRKMRFPVGVSSGNPGFQEGIACCVLKLRDVAIEALGGTTKSASGPSKVSAAPAAASAPAPAKAVRKRKPLTPAQKKAHSERMKAFWAARRKKAGK